MQAQTALRSCSPAGTQDQLGWQINLVPDSGMTGNVPKARGLELDDL